MVWSYQTSKSDEILIRNYPYPTARMIFLVFFAFYAILFF